MILHPFEAKALRPNGMHRGVILRHGPFYGYDVIATRTFRQLGSAWPALVEGRHALNGQVSAVARSTASSIIPRCPIPRDMVWASRDSRAA